MISPYKTAEPARGSFFYDRQFEVGSIQSQAWTWVCGQRRIGKTSLLYKIQDDERQSGRSVPLFFDLMLMDRNKISAAHLFDRFFNRHHKLEAKLASFGLEPGDFKDKDPAECFKIVVDRVYERGKPVTFLWDEAELLIKVEEQNPGFIDSLRGHLHGHEGLRFVVAGSQSLAALFAGSNNVSSFLATFAWLPLRGFDDEHGLAMFQGKQTEGWTKPISKTLAEDAIEWSGGHPLLLAGLGHDLWLQTGGNGTKVKKDTFDTALTRITTNPANKATAKSDYGRLTAPQRTIIDLLCTTAKDLSKAALPAQIGQSEDVCEDALGFLASYGYVCLKGDKVSLRYKFYQDLRPTQAVEEQLTPNLLERIAEPSIFISYAAQDEKSFHALHRSLGIVAKRARIDVWADTRLEAGVPWREEIERALSRATAAVILVSEDYLASAFVREVELPRMLAQAHKGRCKVLPLYVRPSSVDLVTFDIDGSPAKLTTYQGLNRVDQPLSKLGDEEQEEVIVASARAIILAATPPSSPRTSATSAGA